jgi:hypothetical protein
MILIRRSVFADSAPKFLTLACSLTLLATAVAQTGPIIVSNIPPSYATNVSPSAPVVLVFSTNMSTAMTTAQFINASVPPPNTLTVTKTWSADGTRLTNTPNPAFPAGKVIMWLASGFDPFGHPLGGTNMSGVFMTGSGSGTSPALVSVAPTNNAVSVPTNFPVAFTFSVAMDTNLTKAQFSEVSTPSQLLPAALSWSADQTLLRCTPNPGFPAGKVIIWNVQGQGATGGAFPGAGGGFTTAGSSGGTTNSALSGLLSRGYLAEQVDTNVVQDAGQEFVAVASKITLISVAVAPPLVMTTNILSVTGTPDALEFGDSLADATAFVTNYPPGAYQFLVAVTDSVSVASVTLGAGLLPPAPRILNWQTPPRVALGQPLLVQWTLDGSGAAVDYLRLRVEQNGSAVFATPLPDSAGALKGTSNNVVVPAGVFTSAGRATVSLTAFSFTGTDTNAIPGVTLHGARHRTTTFELRVVDGSGPPPVLLTTNLAGVPVGEAFMGPLRTTNSARPMQFQLISGALPPGLVLESEGALTGQATSEGTFDSTLRLTDLLGRTSTQTMRIVTVPVPATAIVPQLENASPGSGSSIQFDVVATPGAECVIERSVNLSQWTVHFTTNAPSARFRLSLPVTGGVAFFRARGPGLTPPKPLTVAPALNTNFRASAEIGSFGGTLNLTNAGGYVFSLNVPPGALDWSEVIQMTDVAQIQGLPLSDGLNAAVDLQPEGLIFDMPARLDITAPTPLNPSTVLGFGSMSDGSEFALSPSFITNRTVSLYLRHFTSAGTGNGSSGGGMGSSPSDPMSAIDQAIEQARQQCLQVGCDDDSWKDQLEKFYIQMADQIVLPKLQNAVKDSSDAVLDDAIFTWLSWVRQMQLLGFANDISGQNQTGEIAKRMVKASSLASQALLNGINKSCQECMNHNVWRIYRMMDLCHYAELLGWSYTDRFWKCAEKCLVFELKIDSKITSQGSKGTFGTTTKSRIKLKPQGDASESWYAQLQLFFLGTATWDITEVQDIQTECPVTSSPAAGTAVIPMAKVHLYKKQTINVPGVGTFVTSVFDPDLEVNLSANVKQMPIEGRVWRCPKDPPVAVDDMFGFMFLGLHNDEVVYPEAGSLEGNMLGGPVIRMKGFEQGGSASDVIFTKKYMQSKPAGNSTVTEDTTIELRHTPKG